MSLREIAIAAPLVVLAIVLGVYPRAMLDYTTPTINRLADNLTDWTMKADQNSPLKPLRTAETVGEHAQQSAPFGRGPG